MSTPNAVHQADLLFLPYDTVRHDRGRKTYKYALTVVYVASCLKEAELHSFCGPGARVHEAATKEMEKHRTNIRRGRMDIYRYQVIVERFNRIGLLSERRSHSSAIVLYLYKPG